MTDLSPAAHSWECRPAGLLPRLRAETRREHARLETDLALLDAPLTPARYAALLERFYGVHAAHEPQLDRLFAQDPFWPPRRRLARLAHDLRLLGRSRNELDALPRAPIPPIETRAQAFGCLYVFEGATLGGQVIGRHVARAGSLPDGATAYFAGRGQATGAMWRETCTLLEREVPEEDHAAAVATARAVFVTLHGWLAPLMPAEEAAT